MLCYRSFAHGSDEVWEPGCFYELLGFSKNSVTGRACQIMLSAILSFCTATLLV
jgi:hypothetical protein